jgi:polyphosphate kinase 2 (PPK2 family)
MRGAGLHSSTGSEQIFLHVSRWEQKKRFMERLEQPDKNWKFSLGDVKERSPILRVRASC